MSLYTVAYNYCTSSKMHNNESVGSLGRRKLNIGWYPAQNLKHSLAGANLMGSDLYNNLIRYFVTHLKGLREVRKFTDAFSEWLTFCNRTGNRNSTRRGSPAVLCGGMVPLHNRC